MKFKEEMIFREYKDRSFVNAETLKGEINKKYPGVDAFKLYVRILNYQVNKYGKQLKHGVERFGK